MTHLLIFMTTLITSITFMQMSHPLAMGLTLLVQTTLICLITGLLAKSFWFSYILFLIFLGGMLVLFIYVTSLASNEMFSISTKLITMMTLSIITTSIALMLFDKTSIYSIFMNNEMTPLINMNSFVTENMFNLHKLYNMPTNYMTILLINYLLIALIAIVKITNVFQGPLRPMN